MQKIKHTFKRSKTPTGADMKIQSSLEVPKQIRSASFDEMKLGSHRAFCDQSSVDSATGGLLQVPSAGAAAASQQRSKSFDSYGSSGSGSSGGAGGGGISPPEETRMFLDVPGRVSTPRKRSSGEKGASVPCVHCYYVDELSKAAQQALHGSRQSSAEENASSSRSLTHSDTSTSDYSDSESEYADEENSTDASECLPAARSSPFRITVTLSPNPAEAAGAAPASPAPSPVLTPPCTLDLPRAGDECFGADVPPQTTSRRRSITSPKLERQEAFIFNEAGDAPPLPLEQQRDSTTTTGSPSPKPDDVIVSQFFLQVPDLKRDRAVSVDSCFIQKSSHAGKPEEVVPVPPSLLLEPPSLAASNAARSKSVDIVLPTEEQAHYKALSTGNTLSIAPRFQDTVVPSTAVSVTPAILG